MGSFNPYTNLVKPGEPVSAGVVNRPTSTLDGNVRYLKDRLDAAEVGSTVFARGVTVEAEAASGMAVYYDPAAGRFARALAGVESAGGVLVASAQSRVWGVVHAKASATLADVLLFGLAPLDLTASAGGNAAGDYYLSGTAPGRLVLQRPPVGGLVLRAAGDGTVFVCPQFVDLLDRHVHYRFDLACVPAGSVSPPEPGARHAVAAADASLPGWLPAGHASFGGRAPRGFAFGYNLAADPALYNAWPPSSPAEAHVEWDKGLDKDVGGTGVPAGPDGLVVVDRYGIWWRSDCYGDAPWPTWYDTGDVAGSSDSLSDSVYPCPRPLGMRMTLWYSRVNFATDTAAVTSLRSTTPRLTVRCVDGSAATAGDLVIALDLNLTSAGDDAAGYLALKSFDPDTASFRRGPVVSGVYAGSGSVTLSGESPTRLDPGDPSSPLVYHGAVGVSVTPGDSREVDVQLIRLDGSADEDFFEDVMFLAFPPGVASSLRIKLRVPADLAIPSPELSLRLRLLGRAAGGLPSLAVTARRLPAAASPADLPLAAAEFAVDADTGATLASANQYVDAATVPFAVAAGDLVFFSVSRSDADSYPGDVGLVDQVGVLTSGA